jgi:hypothetical protein
MPPERVRPKLTMTVDADTVNTINRMISDSMAKNPGKAVDKLANHWRLTSTSSRKDASHKEEIMDEIEQRVARKMEEALNHSYQNLVAVLSQTKETLEKEQEVMREALKEVIKTEVDLAYLKYTGEVAPITSEQPLEPASTKEPELSFEQLLDKCPGSTSNQITDWTAGWVKEIEETNHSIDEFVASKLLRVQGKAKPVSAPKPVVQATVEDVNLRKKADATQKVEFAMVDYWLTKNSDKGKFPGVLPTKEFHVAYAVNRVETLIHDMDNGSGDEFLTQVDERLTKGATARGWDAAAFMDEYDRISRESVQIIERNKEAK